jgi:hypothetical protein
MRIIIEVETKEDIDPNTFVRWLNVFIGGHGDYWAKLIGVESEDDEND